MRLYQKTNNIAGWAVFVIAAIVYTLTVEPTASLWDPSEFIAAAYKLQVPHPPGAPFFLLVGRMFSFLALDDVTQVAYWINMVSVVCSAFTILFLFWTITMLARKILKVSDGEETRTEIASIMGAGIIGALAYTFSDSFWFSAVEAEVYAMSSFFTAFVVWAMLKWDMIKEPSRGNRWLILIAYMMGLSIGAHLLNLVTIPALALIYYFKNYKPGTKGLIFTMAMGGAMIILIMQGIIPGLPSMASALEIYFVNNLGLPFGSGIILFSVLFVSGLIYLIVYSIRRNKVTLHTALMSLTFILIGYSSYTMVVVRSNSNPLIDEFNPENSATFVGYLKREQYGSWPILYGQYYTAEVIDQKEGAPVYAKGENEYEVVRHKIKNIYDPAHSTILPRIHSDRADHQQSYREVLNLNAGEKPAFSDNIKYLFTYQLGHMYLRYFMWNFAGRESDIQNSGFLFPWDALKKLPEEIAWNKARNNFLMLPLVLGVLGLIFQFRKDNKGFLVVTMLFILTGIALILYLNSPPNEPRERDYIYVGSFYAFAIWIGFGVISLASAFTRIMRQKILAPMFATALCLAVPGIMAVEGWDDHDRSDRYFSVDAAKNTLASCAPNAILFTGGDNDTFPLWYAQEVGGFRTDVRVIVLSYFNAEWYLEQMIRPAYESEPLPFSLSAHHFKEGGLNDYLPYVPNPNLKVEAIDLSQYLQLVRDEFQGIQVPTSFRNINTVPAKTLILKVDTEQVRASALVPEDIENLITPSMAFTMNDRMLEKKDLMILDLIDTNKWKRPIYFNFTSLNSIGFGLKEYVVQEGSTYRLLPVRNPEPEKELVNTTLMYDNMMHKSQWRELDNPDVYYTTEDYVNRSISQFRNYFNLLAQELAMEGDNVRAKEVLYESLERIPDDTVPYSISHLQTVVLLLHLDEKEKALEIATTIGKRMDENLAFVAENPHSIYAQNRQLYLYMLQNLADTMRRGGFEEEQALMEGYFDRHYKL